MTVAIAVVALFVVGCVGSFCLGYMYRSELELWHRANRRSPEMIDFTRRRVGS